MSDLMTLEPREADAVVREPEVGFARGADVDALHGKLCPCIDVWSRNTTYL
ncbi:hypothetical protein [Nonomuraea sp. NPDC048826]|uniref:hypothetical protein n=1 Tax=Nonomuraea sp. NPDC048826 TaxID=3364347 RepID=UPI0037187181